MSGGRHVSRSDGNAHGSGGTVKKDERRSGNGQLTLAVVAKAHLGLAQTDGVFASANAVKFLELGLLDILEGGEQLVSGKSQFDSQTTKMLMFALVLTGAQI